MTNQFLWIWVISTGLIVAAVFIKAAPVVAIGIGLTAGLSLARSV
jgi:hypothetical protein